MIVRTMRAATAAFLLMLAAACGEDRGADGLTGEEREKMNQAAERLDANGADVIDASPDSLVANDEWMAAETGEAAADENAANAQ